MRFHTNIIATIACIALLIVWVEPSESSSSDSQSSSSQQVAPPPTTGTNPQVIESIKLLKDTNQTLTNFAIGLFIVCGFFLNMFFSEKANSVERQLSFIDGCILAVFAVSQLIALILGHRVRMDMVTQLSEGAFDNTCFQSMIVNQGVCLILGFFLLSIFVIKQFKFK